MSRMLSTLGRSLNMILEAALDTLTRKMLPSVYTKTTSGVHRAPWRASWRRAAVSALPVAGRTKRRATYTGR